MVTVQESFIYQKHNVASNTQANISPKLGHFIFRQKNYHYISKIHDPTIHYDFWENIPAYV